MDRPSTIGDYRLLELLGQGGMGVVYRALHVQSGQPVALKTVRLASGGALQSIRREIHALARIRHPGIVRVLDEGVHDGLPWYAMELLEGSTLRHWRTGLAAVGPPAANDPSRPDPAVTLEQESGSGWWWTRSLEAVSRQDLGTDSLRPASAESDSIRGTGHMKAADEPVQTRQLPRISESLLAPILTLMRRVCSPLAFLHGEGIVHRDLKPENVWVRPGGMPVLMDFGLVSRFGGELSREDLQVEGGMSGTVAYMAPEQILGESTDARADLYSFGCMLYELVTGTRPFGGSFLQVVKAHLNAVAPRPSELVHGLPAQLDALIVRLLAKRPRERPGHADDVAAVLATLGAGDGYAETAPRPRAYLYRPGFAGREDFLHQLDETLGRAQEGRGEVVLIGGESGVGKTRLVMELARKARSRGAEVLSGGGLPPVASHKPQGAAGEVPSNARSTAHSARHLAGSPLHPLRPALQAIADRCREQGPEETERLLGARGKVLALYDPALAGLPGQETHPEPAVLPPEAARLRLLSYLTECFAALAAERPLLLILDDLQWSDELTLAWLEGLLISERLARTSMLVVGMYRVEEIIPGLSQLLASSRARHLRLGPLEESAMGSMVADMLALDAPPRHFVRYLRQRCEGNPFFVAEYLRTAVAEELLYRDSAGRWQVAEPDGARQAPSEAPESRYEDLPLPRALRDLVGRRLDGLGSAARRLVGQACVLGREVNEKVLAQMGRASEVERMEAVRELLARQVLEESMLGGLRFLHDRIREVAYERLTPGRRGKLHRQAAEAFTASFQDRPEEHLAALGHHWEQAGDALRARECYLGGARYAGSRYADAEAERLYRAYLGLVEHPTRESIQARSMLGFDVFRHQGRNREAMLEYEIGLAEARSIGDRGGEATCLGAIGSIHWMDGRLEDAEALYGQALEIARGLGDTRLEMLSLSKLGGLRESQGWPEQAQTLFEQTLRLARQVQDRRVEGGMLTNLMAVLRQLGNLDKALSLSEDALGIARELGDRGLESRVLNSLAHLEGHLGQLDKARAHREQALALARETGNRRDEAIILSSIVETLVASGRLDEALGLLEQALVICREDGHPRLEAIVLRTFGDIHFLQSRLDEASRLYVRARDVCGQVGDRRHEVWAMIRLASVSLNQGDPDAARVTLTQASTLLQQVGDPLARGQVLREWATLERRTGRATEAQGLAREAESCVRRTGESFELALCLCEQGLIELSLGRPGAAQERLQSVRELASRLGAGEQSEMGQSVSRLGRAVDAAMSGRKLFRGEVLEELPEGLRRWLADQVRLEG